MEYMTKNSSNPEEVNFSIKPQVFLPNGKASSATLQ
jgi:hypothetical protein